MREESYGGCPDAVSGGADGADGGDLTQAGSDAGGQQADRQRHGVEGSTKDRSCN